jgi:hypothetical protein
MPPMPPMPPMSLFSRFGCAATFRYTTRRHAVNPSLGARRLPSRQSTSCSLCTETPRQNGLKSCAGRRFGVCSRNEQVFRARPILRSLKALLVFRLTPRAKPQRARRFGTQRADLLLPWMATESVQGCIHSVSADCVPKGSRMSAGFNASDASAKHRARHSKWSLGRKVAAQPKRPSCGWGDEKAER